MKLGIGIDTGGTCTDAVLYDYDAKKVLAGAKALTTKEDLSIGIHNALSKLPRELVNQAETLALSTTLATNACVEEKGGRAKLIIYGAEPEYVMRVIGKNGTITEKDIICYDTKTSCDGEIRQMPDWDKMSEIFKEELKNCQAGAVVEIYSKKTGSFLEKKTQEIFLKEMDIPVVCGYEIFNELDFIKRGASSLLNARLIPVIDNFLKAVSKSASEFGIDCEPVIVRSDGTLMSKDFARLRPVETLLCGPVASVMGAQELTDVKNALIVDMGGTTSDIAFLYDGYPLTVNGGIHIGNWNTFVKGLFVDTFALGGDSGVVYNVSQGIYLDNRRVIPLCVASETYPHIAEELAEMAFLESKSTRSIYEYYILIDEPKELESFSAEELAICEALKEKPLNLTDLCRAVDISIYDLKTEHLESANIIMRAGITPTDVMHVVGDYNAFNREASYNALQILGKCADNKSVEEMCDKIYDLVKEKLYTNLCRIFLEQQFAWVNREGIGDQMYKLIHETWEQYKAAKRGEKARYINPLFHTDSKLIGIGGPIHIFLDDVAEALGTTAIIPEFAAVANAIGASVCKISFTIDVHITPSYNEYGGIIYYTVFSPGDSKIFRPVEIEEATAYAYERARICAIEESKKRGITGNPEITYIKKQKSFAGFDAVSDIIIEAQV